MNDLFQFFPGGLLLGRRAEHQPANMRAVDFSRSIADTFAKGFSKFYLDERFGENLVACSVSFDDFDGMFLLQQPGEVTLAATYATDQTDHRSSSRDI